MRKTMTSRARSWFAIAGALIAGIVVLTAARNEPALGAVSAASRQLALDLILSLSQDDIDAAGRSIQQQNANAKRELAECYDQLRTAAGHRVEADIRNQEPGGPIRPSQWAPFFSAVSLAHAYAMHQPNIASSRDYQFLKMIERSRKFSEEMMGMRGAGKPIVRQHFELLAVGVC